MRKRTLALLLAATLLGGLSACGSDATSSQGSESASVSTSQEGGSSVEDRSEGDGSSAGDVSVTTPEDSSAGDSSTGGAAVSGPEDTGSASVQEAGGNAANSASVSGGSSEIVAYPPAPETDAAQTEEPTVTTPEPTAEPEPEPVSEPESEPEPVAATADAARAYIGQSASSLIAAIGSPISSSYAPSCLGPGEDGELIYDGFTVYTYRENGVETVEDVL